MLQAEITGTQSNMRWLAIHDHAGFREEVSLAGQEMGLNGAGRTGWQPVFKGL